MKDAYHNGSLVDAIKLVAQGSNLTTRGRRAREAIILADQLFCKVTRMEGEKHRLENRIEALNADVRHHFERAAKLENPDPLPMILHCPECRARHVDAGEFADKPHHTHACQSCGFVWRPAVAPTVGVRFLPGFKDGISDE